MTREELAYALATIQQALDTRVSIVRVIVDATGKEIRRIYRGSFQQPRHSRRTEQ